MVKNEEERRTVSSDRKNRVAITVMRCMLLRYADKHQVAMEQAILDFAVSPIYDALFDFETEIWKEGPDYLMGLYEEYILSEGNQAAP